MGSHGARRGDDEVWERVRAGDITMVADHMSQIKNDKRRKMELRHSANESLDEMWFDESLGRRRRRRRSVSVLVSGMLDDDDAPMHQRDMAALKALQGLCDPKNRVSVEERRDLQREMHINMTATPEVQKTSTKTVGSGSDSSGEKVGTTVAGGSDRSHGSNRLAVGSLFDHIFVRPLAPRETCLKYERHKQYLPLLRVTESAHGRGETNVATHMRNATILTKSYQKYRRIDPNQLLGSYKDKIKLRKLAEQFLHDDNSKIKLSPNSPKKEFQVSSSRNLAKTVERTLKSLEGNTFSLSGPEKYQCFHSKFKEKTSRKRRRRRRKKKKKKAEQITMMTYAQLAVLKELEVVKRFEEAMSV